jgi:hypothetical protein
MESFENIRPDSYKKYASFNKNLDSFNTYTVNIIDSETAIFDLGSCKFNIIPVLKTNKKNLTTEVTIFDQNHPTGLNFSQVTQICSTMHIPLIIEESINGISNSFSFSYKLSAIICDKVQGLTFLSATPEDGLWIWFVVMGAGNSAGKKYLQNMAKEQKKIKDDEAKCWYELMGI